MGTERKAVGTMPEWMRNQERLAGQQERRRTINSASDLLGPGFGPAASTVTDWNADDVLFNGFWSSTAGIVINSPDDTLAWAGYAVSMPDGSGGVQDVWSVADGDPPAHWVRRWLFTSGANTFTGWVKL